MAKRLDSVTDWEPAGGYRVIDAEPVTPSPAQPIGLALVKLFIVPLVIALALWASDRVALTTALLVIPIWAVLYTLLSSETLVTILDHLLLAGLRRREIASQERVRMAEVEMQEQVSLANVRIDADRQLTARAALVASNRTPAALLLRSPAENKLIDAVMTAYELADPMTGYLPNDKTNPFGRRALGAEYAEIVDWLKDPGQRHNVMNCEPIATYDEGRRSWRLNLVKYPTPDVALHCLCGR